MRDEIAVSILLPIEWWREVLAAFAKMHGANALLVAVPTANRIFVTPGDELEAMRFLVDAWLDESPEVELTQQIFRFDGAWSVDG